MKSLIKLILFIIYTLLIFMIKNHVIIAISIIINMCLMIALRINIKKALRNIINISGFLIFTGIINYILTDLQEGILITIKLFIVCNSTYIFSAILSYTQLATAIELLCYPLKIFRINTKDISLIICISIAFIPILKSELICLKNTLLIKGTRKNKYIFEPFFVSILQRLNELEMCLKSKAYQE